MTQPEVIGRELGFLEGLRWHDGRLWASAMNDRQVLSFGDSGSPRVEAVLDDLPSGLGWDRSGRLLVVAMVSRQLRWMVDGQLVKIVALNQLAPFHCNDLLVAPRGHAFVGNFGFDLRSKQPAATTILIRVDENDSIACAADDLAFPNGMALTRDAKHLIVAESHASRLSIFDHSADGMLSGRRVFAEFGRATPDAVAIDGEDGLWVCCVETGMVRVDAMGRVTDRIDLDDRVYACALGGPDGRSLYCSTFVRGDTTQVQPPRTGSLLRMSVKVPAP